MDIIQRIGTIAVLSNHLIVASALHLHLCLLARSSSLAVPFLGSCHDRCIRRPVPPAIHPRTPLNDDRPSERATGGVGDGPASANSAEHDWQPRALPLPFFASLHHRASTVVDDDRW